MDEPITRRSAILRMFGAFSAANLLAWDGLPGNEVRWSAQPTKIVPGERFGDIFLEMEAREVQVRLGVPCKTIHFEAENLEKTLKVFEYINETLGKNMTVKDAFPLRPATTFFNYDRLGLSVGFEHGRVAAIHAYTGVLSGYEGEVKSCFPDDQVPLGATLLKTLDDVLAQCGNPDPDNLISLSDAPIPEITLIYGHGISFAGRADDDRLARITVMKRKAS